jgi:glutamate/tyrosine decarboxylase-like PLP-dependent enzyme
MTEHRAADSLDPADWPAFRAFAHDLLDAMLDRQQRAAEGPVWRPVPGQVKARLAEPPPNAPTPLATLRRELDECVLPYAVGNTHPRFWGWVHGSGTPGGALAELVAATLNENCGGRDHGGIYLERAVVGWARDWFGLPPETGGLLVSGTSMANLLGLAVARHRHGGGAALREQGVGGAPLVGYASTQAHASVAKAFETLGLGRAALRAVPVGADLSMDVAALAGRIAADRAGGLRPFVVVATAGTVNTGAFDDLAAIAELCAREGLWLHVDGAFGAVTRLVPEMASLTEGIDRADSLAFDFHKWLHVPYDAGCVLVRDGSLLRETFGGRPDYLANVGGLSGGEPWPADLGVELSRGFRALKVWWTIKEQGIGRLGAAIARNCQQARRLAERLAAEPRVEIAHPVSLNIVCCRYVSPGLEGDALDALNAAIVVSMQQRGVAVASTSRIGGRLCIRVCIANHRSRNADFELLAREIGQTGAQLAQSDCI